jgi:RimJ/RimL family protein N-acetyltransferase
MTVTLSAVLSAAMSGTLSPALAGTPVLLTARPVLRAPSPADAAPSMAWRAACHLAGHWLHRGCGMFTFADRKTPDAPLGMAGPWYPEGWPEHEIGWSVWNPAAEGKGYAFEATAAARDWAYATLGWTTAVSYIEPANTRSIALAERLGARRDPLADVPRMFGGDSHVWRHPGPPARP